MQDQIKSNGSQTVTILERYMVIEYNFLAIRLANHPIPLILSYSTMEMTSLKQSRRLDLIDPKVIVVSQPLIAGG